MADVPTTYYFDDYVIENLTEPEYRLIQNITSKTSIKELLPIIRKIPGLAQADDENQQTHSLLKEASTVLSERVHEISNKIKSDPLQEELKVARKLFQDKQKELIDFQKERLAHPSNIAKQLREKITTQKKLLQQEKLDAAKKAREEKQKNKRKYKVVVQEVDNEEIVDQGNLSA